MKILLSVLLLTLSSFNICANDDEFYNELLEKHSQEGHLTKDELKEQKFQYSNNKKWRSTFSRQVRGVASTLDGSRDVIKFQNPEIEILVPSSKK